ncbi:hypothetical protein F7734_16145 [Scytonema sp. UIC 10036]|uniref:hypothetical protein n=1 Tax=Scytonema sp. UIC 10036 TaxID=2304196 RepID=UPI0012DAC4E9|nr:hypothetical protein [Scytonema sp. UIC 10036]MUG93862.1 hypothetical protein [Scytonema sp. UIC 10036]
MNRKQWLWSAFNALEAVATTVAVAIALPLVAIAESGPGPGPLGPGLGCNFFPPSAAIGAAVDSSYFGPPPSSVNPSLVGPVQLLNTGEVNFQKGTITIPLYKGQLRTGETVWYILTDTDDAQNAKALGLNLSSKLAYSASGVRTGNFNSAGQIIFNEGKVDFTPERQVQPGFSNRPFPPIAAQPGSMGDAAYSPLVRIRNSGGHVYNAPMIAFNVDASQIHFPSGNPDYKLVHDEVVAIDTTRMTVTLNLVNGFSFGRPVWYISMDANDPTVAAIEGATFAPALRRIQVGNDDSFSSAVERIFIAVNGPSENACENPQRQGLFAALTDGFRPNNTFGGIPTLATDYSPLWDANLYEWTAEAISKGYRSQLREEFQILGLVETGFLTGPNGAKFGSTGNIINCPVVFRLL